MKTIDEGCGTPKSKKGKEKKVEKVMHKWGEGKLHSGSKKGPKVPKKKQDQALAIAFSEAGIKKESVDPIYMPSLNEWMKTN
jgi:hypothetical protein